LKALREEQRYAVVGFHLVDLSVQEIADEVGCPVGTIKARLSRGRAALAASVSNTALAEDHYG
jgi:RNA polymerase sigma-70 factor (ECF subfamily)